ncbi:hypothetical protein [Pseudomonas sp.]|uniref:hypothetical protein n=1 Tax=Pseudomonas sp. TaxID=306 RepID=UPI001B2EF1B0|nr:hypothetical protein [Pseudomonas sp.]MBO9549822.1 hypothetical protein [Pseudomonas sp.]
MATSKAPTGKNSTVRLELAPYQPPSIPALLPDIEDGRSNQLPFNATFTPLRVEFSRWAFSDPSEEDPEGLELFMEPVFDAADGKAAIKTPVASKQWTAYIPDDDLFVEIPTRYLLDGRHKLYYEVTLFNGDVTPSGDLLFSIDRTPPSLGEEPLLRFNPPVPNDELTDAYLQNNDQQLVGALPPLRDDEVPPGFEGETLPYLGAAVGDVVQWYWSQNPAGKDLVGRLDLKKAHLGKPLQLVFPADFIRQSSSGMHFPRYEVHDYAGTAVQRSMSVALNFKGTPVTARTPPTVKEASGNAFASSLKPVDAANGATVVIPADAVVEGAVTTVYWGEPGTAHAYQTDTPVSPGAREYHIPKAYIAPHMGKVVEVHYQVGVIGEKPSQIHRTSVSWLTGLPYVQSDSIDNGLLNLEKLGTAATFTLGSWTHMATSQFVSAWIEGTDRSDVNRTLTLPIANEMKVPAETGPITLGTLAKAELQKLAHRYQFRIHVQVTFDDKTSWLKFPSVDATLVDTAS